MLTRCRAGEIGGLCWNEIRDDVIVLPADRVKNKHAHLVPLALPALAVLAGWKRRHGDVVFARRPFRSSAAHDAGFRNGMTFPATRPSTCTVQRSSAARFSGA